MGGSPKTINPRFIGAVLVATSLTACSALEPVALPSAPEVLNAPEQFSTPAPDQRQITISLLDLFDDPLLRATVVQAQSDNLDLKQSAKRLELAGIDLATTAADSWPRLSGAVNANRGSAGGKAFRQRLMCNGRSICGAVRLTAAGFHLPAVQRRWRVTRLCRIRLRGN